MGAATPDSKWHLRVILRGSPPVYLNVQLDPQRRLTTITHEAVVRLVQTFHSFYMIFTLLQDRMLNSTPQHGCIWTKVFLAWKVFLLLDRVKTCSRMDSSNHNGKLHWRILTQTGIFH